MPSREAWRWRGATERTRPGTLVLAERADVLDFAVVLAPDEPLASARRAFLAG